MRPAIPIGLVAVLLAGVAPPSAGEPFTPRTYVSLRGESWRIETGTDRRIDPPAWPRKALIVETSAPASINPGRLTRW